MAENYVARCSRGLQNWGVGAGSSEVMREIIAKRRMPTAGTRLLRGQKVGADR
jgi:hypothetical protein